MNTVLDLIGEFAALNDAKVRCGGVLPPESEKRWQDLKSFYDLLMSRNGLTRRPVTRRFTTTEIRAHVKSRDRLRVPAELDMVSRIGEEYCAVRVTNVSRGGVFLASERIFPAGTALTLFIASAYGGKDAMFEAEAEVVWVSEYGIAESGLPRGMGVRFVGNQEEVYRQLDSYVIETLEMRLSGVDANALAPDFMLQENLDL